MKGRRLLFTGKAGRRAENLIHSSQYMQGTNIANGGNER
jgi:hypothetical protein